MTEKPPWVEEADQVIEKRRSDGRPSCCGRPMERAELWDVHIYRCAVSGMHGLVYVRPDSGEQIRASDLEWEPSYFELQARARQELQE